MCSPSCKRKISGVDICIALLGSEVGGSLLQLPWKKEKKNIESKDLYSCILFFFTFVLVYLFLYICLYISIDWNALQL